MHSTGELFSTGHLSGDRLLVRLDARVKLIVSLAAILAVLLSAHVALPLATAACCLALLMASGAPLRSMAVRWWGHWDWRRSSACCGPS